MVLLWLRAWRAVNVGVGVLSQVPEGLAFDAMMPMSHLPTEKTDCWRRAAGIASQAAKHGRQAEAGKTSGAAGQLAALQSQPSQSAT